MRILAAALLVVGTFVVCVSATADPDDCRAAIDKFKSARSDVASSLTTYASCVSSSDGHDDCSGDFSSVQSAQGDFESAVSDYESDCS